MRLPRTLPALALLLPALAAAQGTLVIDLNPGGGFAGSGFASAESIPLGDELLFAGNDGSGINLWITDGTAAGTRLVHDIHPGGVAFPRAFTPFGDEVVFLANDAGGTGVWKTDGTSAGTVKLTPPSIFNPSHLTPFRDGVWFHENPGAGSELWKTDGTPAGTALVIPIPTPTAAPRFAVLADELYFTVWTPGAFGYHELWKTDGTAGGTAVVELFPYPLAEPRDLTVVADTLFFSVTDVASGRELWTSDGTPGGTSLLLDIAPGAASSNPEHLEILDGGLLLFADFLGFLGPPRRLWVTDGTAGGTRLLFASALVDVLAVASIGPTAYFFAGAELWETDGTPAGTQWLDEPLIHKYGNPAPLHLGSGDELVFRATGYDFSDDDEVWTTDGVQAMRLVDVNPGSAGSYPHSFRRAGGLLFFGADDGTTGQEVHAIPIVAAGAWVGAGFGTGCGAGALPPALSLGGTATVGGTAQVDLAGAAPSAAAILFWSPDRDALDLGGGCTAYLAAPQVLLNHATDGAGAFALPIAIPGAPALAGLTLYLQDLVAAAGGPLLGVGELSGGLEVVIGP